MLLDPSPADIILSRIISVTDLVFKQLKYYDNQETSVLRLVAHLQVGAEWDPLFVEGDRVEIGDMSTIYGFLHSPMNQPTIYEHIWGEKWDEGIGDEIQTKIHAVHHIIVSGPGW